RGVTCVGGCAGIVPAIAAAKRCGAPTTTCWAPRRKRPPGKFSRGFRRRGFRNARLNFQLEGGNPDNWGVVGLTHYQLGSAAAPAAVRRALAPNSMGPANQRPLWRFARQILETVRREANVAGAVGCARGVGTFRFLCD